MTMKTLTRLLLTLSLVFGSGALVSAQTALNTTTLTNALTTTAQTTLTIGSNTGATANSTALYVNGEYMTITGTSGSTTVTVQRGQGGTPARLHPANSYIWIGPQRAFTTVDPGGTCTQSGTFTPYINIATQRLFACAPLSTGAGTNPTAFTTVWQGWNMAIVPATLARTPVPGNTPYLVLPTDHIVALTTTLQGCGCVAAQSPANKSIVLPSHLGLAGKQLIIVDESGGISATTSIVLVGTINGTHSSSINVVALKTPYSSVTLHAGSGGWFLDVCTQTQATGVVSSLQCR